MSWDVMVLNCGSKTPADELADEDMLPLGSPESVRERISRHLPEVDWSEPAWGVYDGDGFSIEFNTGEEAPITSIMLHVRGGGDPLPTMLQFANPNGWSLYDCTTGAFLDRSNPSPEGWQQFQAFRDHVAESLASGDCPVPARRWWNRTLYWGTNTLGGIVFLMLIPAVGLFEPKKNDMAFQSSAGLFVLVVDLAYRKAVLRLPFPELLFEYEEAGRLLFLPLWFWGGIWLLIAIVRIITG